MAEEHFQTGQNGCVTVNTLRDEVAETAKRCSSTCSDSAPPHKSPRMADQMPPVHTSGGGAPEADQDEAPADHTAGSPDHTIDPTTRRKSFRRATMTRRSLPALPNQYRDLCRSISTSLSQQERLEKLMEASMKLAIKRTEKSLQSVPNASLETFHKQVELMEKEWKCLAKTFRSEPKSDSSGCRDPVVQRAMENLRKAINRVQTESASWEALLEKHHTKAKELERKVEQGLQTGVPLDSTSVTQSSQYHLIQNKPDYHSLLRRLQPLLNTVSMIMDSQRKLVRQLVNIKKQSQLLVKETSRRLAADAGCEDLSPDIIKKLMAVPLSSKTA